MTDTSERVLGYIDAVRGRLGVGREVEIDAFGFGDSPEMADELGRLVFAGKKRATTSLLAAVEAEGESGMARVGGYSVVLDGRGEPMGVIRTTAVAVRMFTEVDEAFDGSLAYWREAHRQIWRRECAALGVEFEEEAAWVWFVKGFSWWKRVAIGDCPGSPLRISYPTGPPPRPELRCSRAIIYNVSDL